MAAAPILITADELNCLVHAYLLDSGYHHSAFSLKSEAHLDRTPHFKRHIQRGELVALLSKSLLYAEVEAHWKAGEMAINCKTPFTLLEPHVCSTEVSGAPEVILAPKNGESSAERTASLSQEAKTKRKEAEHDDGGKGKMLASEEPRQSSSSTAKSTAPVIGGITSPAAIRTLRGHRSEIFVVSWNPARAGQLVSGSRNGVVNRWEVPILDEVDDNLSAQLSVPCQTLMDLSRITMPDLTSFDWSPDGRLIAVGSYHPFLRVFGPDGSAYIIDDTHKKPIFAVKFSPSGKYLATASLDATSLVWDVQRKIRLKHYKRHRQSCLDVEWLDDSTLATCGQDYLIHFMSLEDPSFTQTLTGHTNEVNVIKCNPSRTKLASCSDDTTARVWTLNSTESSSIKLEGHRGSLTTISWCPVTAPGEVELLASASFDSTTRLWNTITGECLRVFRDHTESTFTLAFSPEGRMLASGSADGFLHVYDTRTLEKRWTWSHGEKCGVFDINWRGWGKTSMIALALERPLVVAIDTSRVLALALSD